MHGLRKISNYVVFVGVEWAWFCSYCGVRSLCARKQQPLLYFSFEFSFNLLPRTCPLVFEMQRVVPRDSIQILLVFVGWRKVSDDTLSSSWLFPRFLKFLATSPGTWTWSTGSRVLPSPTFFSCALYMKMGIIENIGCTQWPPARDTFRSSKMFCNRKIKKRWGNFLDAIFHVNLQFFFLISKLCLFIVRLLYCYFRLEYVL